MNERVVLITGASSGIGCACALYLAERGFRVYGTSRCQRQSLSLPFPVLPLDLADGESGEGPVEEVMRREGRLDIVVNNAGMGIAGPVECTAMAEARRQFEVNFFGAVRMTQAALPILRRQGCGYIINIGSIGGLIALPYQAMYSASKFALEGLSEALRLEAAPFGIRVVLIEPGDHKTAFTFNRRREEIPEQARAYQNPCSAAIQRMERDEQNGAAPEKVARLLYRIVNLKNPRLRYTVGPPSQRAAVWMKRFLPNSLVERSIRMHYGLNQPCPHIEPVPRK